MSLICSACSDIKLAMQAANSSIELIPEDDTEYRSFAYYTRSILWGNLGKWDNAINDITESIRINPNDAESFKTRAEMYLNTEQEYSLWHLRMKRLVKNFHSLKRLS